MESLKEFLESKNIRISPRYYGDRDSLTMLEIQAIIANLDIFGDLYSRFPLKGVVDFDSYYEYLLLLKFERLSEMAPQLEEEHRRIICKISDDAKRAVPATARGDAIKFINDNVQALFDNQKTSWDVQDATLDIITKCQGGMVQAIEFLCKSHGCLLINRFEKFAHFFECNPEKFGSIHPTGSYQEIAPFLEKTLDVWSFILRKKDSPLKKTVESRLRVLAGDVKSLCESANVDNIMFVAGPIRSFISFLRELHNPLANDFSEVPRTLEKLMSRFLKEKGKVSSVEFPIDKIMEMRESIPDWWARLLLLTHYPQRVETGIQWTSQLSYASERTFLDCVGTNFPTDEFFTASHQQNLRESAQKEMFKMAEVIKDQQKLTDYFQAVNAVISFIAKELGADEERLLKDAEMAFTSIQLIAVNKDADAVPLSAICYGASMYLCAFSETLLRRLYIYLARNEQYIPVNRATLGDMLAESNSHIVDVFERNHVMNLAFFFLRDQRSNIGENIRNSLAHWDNVSPSAINPALVTKILWLFTDILNTIFLYCWRNSANPNDGECQS